MTPVIWSRRTTKAAVCDAAVRSLASSRRDPSLWAREAQFPTGSAGLGCGPGFPSQWGAIDSIEFEVETESIGTGLLPRLIRPVGI